MLTVSCDSMSGMSFWTIKSSGSILSPWIVFKVLLWCCSYENLPKKTSLCGFRPSKTGGSVVVDLLFIVTPIVGVCNCSSSSFAITKNVSWWGRESWLLCLICLPGVSWLLRGSASRCHGFVCSLWLWSFLIILAIFEPATETGY